MPSRRRSTSSDSDRRRRRRRRRRHSSGSDSPSHKRRRRDRYEDDSGSRSRRSDAREDRQLDPKTGLDLRAAMDAAQVREPPRKNVQAEAMVNFMQGSHARRRNTKKKDEEARAKKENEENAAQIKEYESYFSTGSGGASAAEEPKPPPGKKRTGMEQVMELIMAKKQAAQAQVTVHPAVQPSQANYVSGGMGMGGGPGFIPPVPSHAPPAAMLMSSTQQTGRGDFRARAPYKDDPSGEMGPGIPPMMKPGPMPLPATDPDAPNGYTSNLFLNNLSPMITEEALVKAFMPFGAIASVKVMWPRAEEEKRTRVHCGFIAYMELKDAEHGLQAMQGKMLMGYELQINWGKAMPRPAAPLYVMDGDASTAENHISPDAERFEIKDEYLSDEVVNTMASFTAKHGIQFEMTIRAREADTNPNFAFLKTPNERDPRFAFYKWRVYSLLQGDTMTRWREQPFQMFNNGPVWIPPKMRDGPQKEQPPVENPLFPEKDQEELIRMLRKVSVDRKEVMEVMVYVIEKAEVAKEVADLMAEALTINATPIASKLARLYVLNDVLHNSSSQLPSAKGAYKYRAAFEPHCNAIFASFHEAAKTLGRIRFNQLKEQVLLILECWDKWCLYTPRLIERWKTTFQTGGQKK